MAADFIPLTNLRGPAARIVKVNSVTLPPGSKPDVVMTGPDQGREFTFLQAPGPAGAPGTNAVANDEAFATYIGAETSLTRAALEGAVGSAVATAAGDRPAIPAAVLPRVRTAVLLGDSHGEGKIGLRNFLDGFANRIEKALQASYNSPSIPGGYGVRPSAFSDTRPDAAWSIWGVKPPVVSRGLGNQAVQLTSDTTMRHTAIASTGLTVRYAEGPGVGAFSIQVDEEPPVVITPDTGGALRFTASIYVAAAARGVHTYSLTGTSVVAAEIDDTRIHDGDEVLGFQLINSARGGYKSADFIGTGATLMWQRITSLKPDMFIIELGDNEIASNVPPATLRTNLETILVSANSASASGAPWVAIVLKQPRFTTTGYTFPWSDYVKVYNEFAAAHPAQVTLFNLSPVLPRNAADDQVSKLVLADGTHFTPDGQRFFAERIADAWRLTASARQVRPLDLGRPIVELIAQDLVGGHDSAVTVWKPTARSFQQEPFYVAGTGAPKLDVTGTIFGGKKSVHMNLGTLVSRWPEYYSAPFTMLLVVSRNRVSDGTFVSAPTGPDGQVYEAPRLSYSTAGWLATQGVSGNQATIAPATAAVPNTGAYLVAAVFNGGLSEMYFSPRTGQSTKDAVAMALTNTDFSGISGLRLGGVAGGAVGSDATLRIAHVLLLPGALMKAQVVKQMAGIAPLYSIALTP